MLALLPGGALRDVGRVAVLAEVAMPGNGSMYRVRDLPWLIGPTWRRGVAFEDSVRCRSAEGDAGRLIGSRSNAAELLCGLCGRPLCAPGVPIDTRLASHALAPSWARRGGV